MTAHPSPGRILETCTGFWASKVLLTAVEFDIFSRLAERRMTGPQLAEAVGIHPRGTYDFLDALVALGFLARKGDGPTAIYENTPETGLYLNHRSPAYMGGIAQMLNSRLFGFWNDLGKALRTGQAQNETQRGMKATFEELYSDEGRLNDFISAMTGFQASNFAVLAEKFDFANYNTVTDVGGAAALLSRTLAKKWPHLTFKSFDLPPVKRIADRYILGDGLSDRVEAVSGDFFKDTIPEADVVTMGNILHDWNLEKKKHLVRQAFNALPKGGVFIAIENVIDDARRTNVFGLLMSLNMLIEFGEDGFDYTGADFRLWCGEAGFSRFDQIPLTGPASAAIAYK